MAVDSSRCGEERHWEGARVIARAQCSRFAGHSSVWVAAKEEVEHQEKLFRSKKGKERRDDVSETTRVVRMYSGVVMEGKE